MATHGAVASDHLGRDQVEIVLSEQWATAPIDQRAQAGLMFLATFTLEPEMLTIERVQSWMAQGINLSGMPSVGD